MRVPSEDTGHAQKYRIMMTGRRNCQVKWRSFRANRIISKESGLPILGMLKLVS